MHAGMETSAVTFTVSVFERAVQGGLLLNAYSTEDM